MGGANDGDDESHRDRRPDQHNRRDGDSKFSINTSFNIAHILTTVGLIVAMFSWATEVKTIIATNTSEIKNIKEERARESVELRTTVREIDAKVTRLLERGSGDRK
jgi:uncharacterized protein YlxW (UPF0749 family)